MSDTRIRDLERRWRETGALDDEAAFLAERVRVGDLAPEVTVLAAYFGSKVAGLVHGDVQTPPYHLTTQNIKAALRLVFGDKTELPPRTRDFLINIVHHDRLARAILTHYGLVDEQQGDIPPPDPSIAIKALMDDLRENSNHREAIAQMHRPVFQLVPVYEPEGAGFQRMVNAIDAHRRVELGQEQTHVIDELQSRWGMNSEKPSQIVGWQVAVVEGAKELLEESNPHRNETLAEQLRLWQEECSQRGLELCDNRSYALLQMKEIRLAIDVTDILGLGIDPDTYTVLKDTARQPGSLITDAGWNGRAIYFSVSNLNWRNDSACFRPMVVIKKIF